MDSLKVKYHPKVLVTFLAAAALLCGSIGVAKLKNSATSVLLHTSPAAVQVADGVSPPPPPPPPPPHSVRPQDSASLV
jgi:hypothetical protein